MREQKELETNRSRTLIPRYINYSAYISFGLGVLVWDRSILTNVVGLVLVPLAIILGLVGYGRPEGRWAAVGGTILGMVGLVRILLILIGNSSPY
jgi:hypothetical protein